MTVIAQYDTINAELDLQPQPEVVVRIFTSVESSVEIRTITDLWDLVSLQEFDRLIRDIVHARYTWSRDRLQNDPVNHLIYERSNYHYQFLHCSTVYNSNRPNCMLISIEIGSRTQI